MFRSRRFIEFIATCFAIGAFAFGPAPITAAVNGEETTIKIVDLAPFTHIAYIPVDTNLSSIRLKGFKAVMVATKRRSVTNLHYCEKRRLAAEPGGSMYCPLTIDESPVPAYQLSYTFIAPPMASDEYGNRTFTFSVYFHPDEIGSNLRRALASSKVSGTDLSEYFRLTVSREPIHQFVIDEANSTVCDGNYIDGNWSRSNPNCQDSIIYKKVASASPYITVRIDPASPLQVSVATTGLR